MKIVILILFASIIFSCNKSNEVVNPNFYQDNNIVITSAKAESASTQTKISFNITGDVSKVKSIKVYTYPTGQLISLPALVTGENSITTATPGAESFTLWIYDENFKPTNTPYFKAN